MPRDDQYISGPREFNDYGVRPDGTEVPYWFGNVGHLSLDKIRDESHGTMPAPGGEFYLSTMYWAQSCRLRSNNFSYLLNSSGPWSEYPKHRIKGQSASGFWPLPWNSAGCSTTRPHLPLPAQWVVEGAKSDALQKMKQQDFNAGVFLGELPETVSYIAGIVEPLGALFQEYENLRHRGGISTKKLANAWLGFSLGAKPLMDDIYNAAKRCVEGFSVPLFAVVETSRLDPEMPAKFDPPGGFWGWNDMFWHYRDNSVMKRGVNVKIAYRVINPTLYALDAFGIMNPLSIAWEMLQYSFVVDYFLGVGNFLQAMSAPIGVQFVFGHITSWVKNTYDVEYVPKAYNGLDYSGGNTWPRVTGEFKSMSRVALTDFPTPLPAIRMPVSVNKALNILALLTR